MSQLNDAIADLSRTLRSAIASSKTDTLQHVSTQLEKLGKQTQEVTVTDGEVKTVEFVFQPK